MLVDSTYCYFIIIKEINLKNLSNLRSLEFNQNLMHNFITIIKISSLILIITIIIFIVITVIIMIIEIKIMIIANYQFSPKNK